MLVEGQTSDLLRGLVLEKELPGGKFITPTHSAQYATDDGCA